MLVRQVFASVLAAMAAVGVAAQEGDDDFTTPQEGLPSPTSDPSPTGEGNGGGDGPTPTDSADRGAATHTIAVGAVSGHKMLFDGQRNTGRGRVSAWKKWEWERWLIDGFRTVMCLRRTMLMPRLGI